MNNLIFRLNNTLRSLLWLLLFIIFFLDLLFGLSFLILLFFKLFGCFLLLKCLFFLLADIFLKLGLVLGHIHIVNKGIVSFDFDTHKLWLFTFTIDVLKNFVISGNFFLVLSKHTVDAIKSGISYELLEIGVDEETGYVCMEHDIISHTNLPFFVLIVFTLRASVRQAPWCTLLAGLRIGLSSLLRFLDTFVPANIDECLLVKEGFVNITDHTFRHRLDTETSFWFNKSSARWHLTSFFKLSEVLVLFRSVFGVGDLVNVFTHHFTEFRLLHSFGKGSQLFFIHFKFFAFHEGMVHSLISFLLGCSFYFNSTKIFWCVWVHFRFLSLC